MQQNFLLKKENLPNFLRALGKDASVFVPCVDENGASAFLPYNGQGLFLKGQTHYSFKKILHPPTEKEFSFRKKSSSFELSHHLERGRIVLFGIRPCDTHAIKAFDMLYLQYYTTDPFYKALRDHALLIALECSKACQNGFCQSLNTDKPTGHDLLFIEKEKSFFVEAASEKGKQLLEKHRGFFNQTKFAKPMPRFSCRKSLETKNLKGILDKNFFHGKWVTEGAKCLNCTACTQVCPSCYCFLTFDKFLLNSENSERFRQWDSCQLKQFTKIAGSHVFRSSRESRLRQFVMHKLSYFQENHEMMLCVGCGRCITICPVGIDLTEIAATIRGNSK